MKNRGLIYEAVSVGNPGSKRNIVTRHLLLLFCLGSVLWVFTCGLWDLRGPDEGRYVQIAKELLQRSNWLSLTVHGSSYDQKPPLMFWFIASSLSLFGEFGISWAARLPACLMGIGTVMLTYALAWRAGRGDSRPALAAGLVLLSTPLFMENVPQAELNVAFGFWITLAVTAWYFLAGQPARLRELSLRVLFWLALSAAFFTKGPLAFVVVFAPVFAESIAGRSWRPLLRLSPLPGSLLTAGLICAWLYAEATLHGKEFVGSQVSGQTLNRLLHGTHTEPFWYYFPRLFTALFPWFLVLPPAAFFLWKNRKTANAQSMRPFIAWMTIPFILLCLANGKRQSYLIPLLPPVAVLVGTFVTTRTFSFRRLRFLSPTVAGLYYLAGIGLVVCGLAFIFEPTIFNKFDFSPSSTSAVLWILFGCAFILTQPVLGITRPANQSGQPKSRRDSPLFPSLAILLVCLSFIRFTTLEPALDSSKSTRSFAREIESLGAASVCALGRATKPEYHVYGNYRVHEISRREAAEPHSLPDFLIMPADAPRAADHFTSAGYQLLKELDASGDRLAVFARSRDFQFAATTPPGNPAVETLDFALMGDSGMGNRQIDNNVKQIMGIHRHAPLAALFLLGDNVYSGDDFDVDVKRVFVRPFAPVLAEKIPVFAALGNHDYAKQRWRGEVEFADFNMGGRRYYLRNFGRDLVTFFVLDSESMAGKHGDPAQIEWLKTALADCRSVWKIALIHRPLNAGSIDHGAAVDIAHELIPVLNGPYGDVDLVVSGHNHVYERRRVGADGILHVTIGSSAKSTKERFRPDAQRTAGYLDRNAFLHLTFRRNVLRLEAINDLGEVVDAADVFDHDDNPGRPTVDVKSTIADGSKGLFQNERAHRF